MRSKNVIYEVFLAFKEMESIASPSTTVVEPDYTSEPVPPLVEDDDVILFNELTHYKVDR